jgi:hypothetical protein
MSDEPRTDTDPPAGDVRPPFGFRQDVDERKPKATKEEATRSLTTCTTERVSSSWVQRPGYQPAEIRS